MKLSVPKASPFTGVAFGEGLGKPCASAKASAARGWRPMGESPVRTVVMPTLHFGR